MDGHPVPTSQQIGGGVMFGPESWEESWSALKGVKMTSAKYVDTTSFPGTEGRTILIP